MNKGKRYNGETERKLNMKKVFAIIIAFLVIVMFVAVIVNLVKPKKETTEKQVALAYYTVFENNKWGVINSKGETVINPTYEEMVVIPNKEKSVFIVTYDVDYENDTYKSKAVDSKNTQLFTSYETVEAISNIDAQNNIWYETNCLKVKKNGKYGLIDFSGKILLDCQYDVITPLQGIKNSLVTVKENKKGLVSTTGTVIIDNQYKDIKSITAQYEDGYIVENDEGKLGVIGTNKKIVLETNYDDIKNICSDDTYIVKENESWKIYNTSKNASVDFNYDSAISINNGYIVVEKNDKYGIVTVDGEEKINPEYQDIKYIFQEYYIAKKDNKCGIINIENETKLEFTYDDLTYIKEANIIEGSSNKAEVDLIDSNFNLKLSGILSQMNIEEGYMKIRIGTEYKYYNFKFEEKKNTQILKNNTLFLSKENGKYGFVDKNGIVVVNYIYDDATEQNESGYVAVKKDGKWGALNSKGEEVVEPKYTLENNTKIDFIGDWHLAEDTNAGYYIK